MILNILKRILGEPKNDDNKQLKFNCPRCAEKNGYKPDNKFNLEINLDNKNKSYKYKKIFHCWKCDSFSGPLNKLVKYYGSKDQYKLYLEFEDEVILQKNIITEKVDLKLPDEFISFENLDLSDFRHKKAYEYLTIKRKITDEEIKKYKMGFCLSGKYHNRIIIPDYNSKNELTYFVSRSFINATPTYLNPKADKTKFIFNESNINWNSTIFLVEGVFDMLALSINTIPLLGKVMHPILFEKIVKHKPNVVILLDEDAKENALVIKKKLLSVIDNVKVINIMDKDLAKLREESKKNEIIKLIS